MIRKSKEEKAITLIALIMTIVVLLILAAVAISSITNDNILGYAQNAAKDYNQAVKNEQEMLQEYVNFLNGNGGSAGGEDSEEYETIASAKTSGKTYTSNTILKDDNGNLVTVPAGFKIASDSATSVTGGVVIEDATYENTIGSQFVWIPVGTIYTSADKSTSETIVLGRYSDFSTTPYTPVQTAANYATATTISSCTEDTASSHDTSYGNAIARNIENFITSATTKGGYYLGRYEAGDSSNTELRTGTSGTSTEGTLVCKANQVPYNWITQPDASSKCQSMYADGYSRGTFSSDLINSYAWDTAIIFIQTFGTKTNSSTYASTVGQSPTDTTAPQTTGTNILDATSSVDEQLNIYDMTGNCQEWSTESVRDAIYPCVARGGSFYRSGYYTSGRYRGSTTISGDTCAFRPLLYVGL